MGITQRRTHSLCETTKNISLSKISVNLPSCLEIKDFINVNKYEKNDTGVDVIDIGKSSISKYDYFGVIIASTEPFEELARKVKSL